MNGRMCTHLMAVVLALCVIGCSKNAQRVAAPELDPSTGNLRSDASPLSSAEGRLDAIAIPEIDFRGANIRDVIEFLDSAVTRFGGERDKTDAGRIRIVADVGQESTQPVITFAGKGMSILHALRLAAALGGLEYRVQGNTVTVSKRPEANTASHGTALPRRP